MHSRWRPICDPILPLNSRTLPKNITIKVVNFNILIVKKHIFLSLFIMAKGLTYDGYQAIVPRTAGQGPGSPKAGCRRNRAATRSKRFPIHNSQFIIHNCPIERINSSESVSGSESESEAMRLFRQASAINTNVFQFQISDFKFQMGGLWDLNSFILYSFEI